MKNMKTMKTMIRTDMIRTDMINTATMTGRDMRNMVINAMVHHST